MTELVRTALSPNRPGFPAGLVAALALLAPDVSTSARADAAVSGPIGAVQVEARDSSVAEVLTALGAAYGLRYRTWIDLSRPVAGTLRGPVSTVISRLLKDYDYVVKSSSEDRIEVTVIKLREQVSDKATSAGASPHPPELLHSTPPAPGSSTRQASDKIISTIGSPYPPELFRPNPFPSPASGSNKATSTGGGSYPAELFQPRPPPGSSR